MAKIEIDLSEIEHLKSQNEWLKSQVEKLEGKLANLDERKLKEKAVNLSVWLFDQYMTSVFKGLGFDDQGSEWNHRSIGMPDNLEHYLGKSWWNSDRLTFNISAEVSKKFRRAFLSIGVNPDVPKKEETLEWVEDATT